MSKWLQKYQQEIYVDKCGKLTGNTSKKDLEESKRRYEMIIP